MVRRAPCPGLEARERGEQLHVVPVVGAVVADLLEGAHADEGRHGEDEGQHAGVRHSRRHADQVRLADPEIEVPLREAGGERTDGPEVLRQEDDVRVPLRQLDQHVGRRERREVAAHRVVAPSSAASVCRASSSVSVV